MKTLLLTITLLITFSVGAGTVTTIVETTNPALDTTFLDVGVSHWDTTTGLEWLDFSELVADPLTLGHSLNSAEIAYDENNGGWKLASFDQVTTLFNRFFSAGFVDSGNGSMLLEEGDGQSTMIQSRNSWLLSFGSDVEITNGTIISDETPLLYSSGLYLAEDGTVQMMGLSLTTNPMETTLYGQDYQVAGWDENSWNNSLGVFMVRDYTVVPIPAAIWLFGSGLIGLMFVSRRKLQ